MKKSAFNITVRGDKKDETKVETVNGLTSKYFGIHKVDGSYIVTHLSTGMSIRQCISLMSHARKIVNGLESGSFPILWAETDIRVLYANIEPAREVVFAIH